MAELHFKIDGVPYELVTNLKWSVASNVTSQSSYRAAFENIFKDNSNPIGVCHRHGNKIVEVGHCSRSSGSAQLSLAHSIRLYAINHNKDLVKPDTVNIFVTQVSENHLHVVGVDGETIFIDTSCPIESLALKNNSELNEKEKAIQKEIRNAELEISQKLDDILFSSSKTKIQVHALSEDANFISLVQPLYSNCITPIADKNDNIVCALNTQALSLSSIINTLTTKEHVFLKNIARFQTLGANNLKSLLPIALLIAAVAGGWKWHLIQEEKEMARYAALQAELDKKNQEERARLELENAEKASVLSPQEQFQVAANARISRENKWLAQFAASSDKQVFQQFVEFVRKQPIEYTGWVTERISTNNRFDWDSGDIQNALKVQYVRTTPETTTKELEKHIANAYFELSGEKASYTVNNILRPANKTAVPIENASVRSDVISLMQTMTHSSDIQSWSLTHHALDTPEKIDEAIINYSRDKLKKGITSEDWLTGVKFYKLSMTTELTSSVEKVANALFEFTPVLLTKAEYLPISHTVKMEVLIYEN